LFNVTTHTVTADGGNYAAGLIMIAQVLFDSIIALNCFRVNVVVLNH